MFSPPPVIHAEVFATLPPGLRRPGFTSEWTEVMRHGTPTDSFLEGPAFGPDGTLYLVNIPFGEILRMSPAGEFEVAARYDGQPCGLAFGRDGRIFIADYLRGIMVLDPATGAVQPHVERNLLEGFRGCNDLHFSPGGDLYFTDQGQTGLQDPTGRLYRVRPDGRLECLLANVPSPNGLALSPDGRTLYLAVTRANSIWRVPLLRGGTPKVGTFIQLSGSLAGPDGLAVDEAGNLAVAHAGLGVVWLFSRLGEPLARIQSRTGIVCTNVAYGGPERRSLFITESDTGNILRADLEVPGLALRIEP